MALVQSLQTAAMQVPASGIACAAATRYALTRLRSNPRVRGALGSVMARGKAIASSAVLHGDLEDYKTLKKGVTYATPTKDPNEKSMSHEYFSPFCFIGRTIGIKSEGTDFFPPCAEIHSLLCAHGDENYDS